jgi:hypothetical protein
MLDSMRLASNKAKGLDKTKSKLDQGSTFRVL